MSSSRFRRGGLALALTFVVHSAAAVLGAAQQPPPAAPSAPPKPQEAAAPARPETPGITEFTLRSACVSEFWKKDRMLEAGVVEPLDRKEGERLPVVYNIHGFGGSHRTAWRQGAGLQRAMAAGTAPRMLYVFLNAQWEWGHHEFADSRAGGPWGRALTTEFIPALEAKFGAVGEPWARFVTGHSSGGWSSLWLQVTYPEFFGGCWSTAPDSVDFRDFTGVDIYSYENAFTDPEGRPIMLVRQGGKFVSSIEQFCAQELANEPVGGQFFSFNAVFSERGPDGLPRRLFDPKTGAIDSAVADSWQPYDISLQLREHWDTLGPKLEGKVHVWMGLQDTFRLEGALILMKEELAKLGAKLDILLVEGRDHGTLYAPHPELWPKGMMERIHREMHESYVKAAAARGPR